MQEFYLFRVSTIGRPTLNGYFWNLASTDRSTDVLSATITASFLKYVLSFFLQRVYMFFLGLITLLIPCLNPLISFVTCLYIWVNDRGLKNLKFWEIFWKNQVYSKERISSFQVFKCSHFQINCYKCLALKFIHFNWLFSHKLFELHSSLYTIGSGKREWLWSLSSPRAWKLHWLCAASCVEDWELDCVLRSCVDHCSSFVEAPLWKDL